MTVMHTFPLGVHRLTISAYSLSGNGGVELVYRTMAKTLAIVCNEHPNDWDVHLSHVEYASAATGLAFNEVHIGGLPRLAPSLSSNTPTLEPVRVSTVAISPIATLPENGNSAPTSSCVNSTPLQSLV